MAAHELSFSQPPQWALIGELPFSSVDLTAQGLSLPCNMSRAASPEHSGYLSVPCSADNDRALKKWLKKQWHLPLLVVTMNTVNAGEYIALLRFLRQDLSNTTTRLICFVPPAIRQQLLPELSALKIHHLYQLNDLQADFLASLIGQEWQEYSAAEQLRSRRDHEMELLTFLARMNREAEFSTQQMAELASLLQGLIQASALLYVNDDAGLCGVYPPPLAVSQSWQNIAEQALAADISADRPLLLQLDRSRQEHSAASALTSHPISASILFPLRCYEKTSTWFIAFLTEEAASQLDVARLSLLEKTVEQIRTQLERQLSESRLKIQYQRLQNTLSRLHQTQEQLYHSEKLSAVGQLAAGIAHEINNPVSFIMSNFEPLDEYIQTMSRMLNLHEEFTHAIHQGDDVIGSRLRQQISQEREAADLEFMMEDIYSLVNESKNGLKRVSDIVTNLRTFARRDGLETSAMDLCECIHSAVNLMKHQLNSGIDTRTELPQSAVIEGNPGLLGQVIVNLIQNAVHAMQGHGVLSVRLYQQDNIWLLEVEDSGSGIPQEIQSKIFDPFFTTKEIGKGTGLGLSTVYSIIQRHQGDIKVSSVPGKTCFRVSLPAHKTD